jgi:Rrf2 family protein
MLSRKAKYGLKALIHLAHHAGEGPVLIEDLAQSERIPRKFLEQILLELKKKGLLASRKGRGGGYQLGKGPDAIFMGEIIRVLDGPLAPVPCVSVTAYGRCDECLDERTCGIRLVMQEVRDGIAGILDTTSLADVLRRVAQEGQRPSKG